MNEYVERQGFKTYVHDIDSDDIMRRVQMKVEKNEKTLGQSLGFFNATVQVCVCVYVCACACVRACV